MNTIQTIGAHLGKMLALWGFLGLSYLQGQTLPDSVVPTWVSHSEMNYNNVEPSSIVDTIFGQLDPSFLSTGILINRSIPFLDLDLVQGDPGDTTVDLEIFQQGYHQIYQAHVSNPLIPSVEDLNTLASPLIADGIVPIAILDFEYDQIKEDALDQELISLDEITLKDILPRNTSPYKTKSVFMAIPYKRLVPGVAKTFRLDPSFYFTNTGRQISGLELSMNGQSYTIGLGQSLTLTPQSEHVTVKLNYSNSPNSPQSTYSSKYMGTTGNGGASDAPQTTLCDPDWIHPLDAHLGAAEDTYCIGVYQGCKSDPNSFEIRKPILLVEGFDPENGRYFTLTDEEEADQAYDKHLYYIANGYNFADKLRAKGYDLLIFNNGDGTGDIESAAGRLEEAINWVNSYKSTKEELIVIGASMGGLISRFALAHMEEEGDNHFTKLLMTFDSPHRGAYLSLGLQHTYDYLFTVAEHLPFGLGNAVAKQRQTLDAKGTQQLLNYHYKYSPGYTSQPSPDQHDFFAKLHALNGGIGYPMKCRKIAVANGSSNATKQANMGYHDKLVEIDFSIALLSLFSRTWALPDLSQGGGLKKISRNNLMVIVPIAPGVAIPIWHRKTKKVNHSLPYDNCPAGNDHFHKDFKDLIKEKLRVGIFWARNANNAFIPTMSSLDLDSINVPDWNLLYNVKSNYNIGNANSAYTFANPNIPFDAIYCSPENQRHVYTSITDKMFQFLEGELSPDILHLQNDNMVKDSRFSALNSIVAGYNVTNSRAVGDLLVTTPAPGKTEFVAGESIHLKDGFLTPGGDFLARIDPGEFVCVWTMNCDNSASKTLGASTPSSPQEPLLEAIYDLDNESPRVFPNPSAHGRFNLVMPARYDLQYQLRVVNATGKTILSRNETSYNCVVDLSKFPRGMYWMQIKDRGETTTVRLVTQ